MRMLTIRQPWADAIVGGIKTIETRSWPTKERGWILIHAASIYGSKQRAQHKYVKQTYGIDIPLSGLLMGVVGMAKIIDCRPFQTGDELPSLAEQGDQNLYCWILKDARPLPFVRCPGFLGLRQAPDLVINKLKELGVTLPDHLIFLGQ